MMVTVRRHGIEQAVRKHVSETTYLFGAPDARRRRTGIPFPSWDAGLYVAATLIVAAAISVGCARVLTPVNHGFSTTDPIAPSPIPLKPNDRGYVHVETNSGSTRCSITTRLVACQRSPDSWRTANGQPCHTVSVRNDGDFHCVDADLGALQGRVRLDYQTYNAQGWTIVAGPASTRFTNDRSGHGFSVSDQRVTPF